MEENKKNEHASGHHDEVTIHIDKRMFKSPNPTSGSALYTLGAVDSSKYDLFLEVLDKGDDPFIPCDGNPIELKNGEHFYTVQKNLNPGTSKNGRGN